MVNEPAGHTEVERCMSGVSRKRGASSLLGLFILTFILLTSRFVHAQTKEYQVKAAFLFNFAQFVQWPTNAFPNAEAPFTIGILGDNPFGRALEETVRNESVQGHRIVVSHSQQLQDVEHCQMVFISKSERGHVGEILSRFAGRNILTVSELPGFANRGGVINFYPEGTKVRFEINAAAAQRERLKISSELLSLGKIVEPELSKGGP